MCCFKVPSNVAVGFVRKVGTFVTFYKQWHPRGHHLVFIWSLSSFSWYNPCVRIHLSWIWSGPSCLTTLKMQNIFWSSGKFSFPRKGCGRLKADWCVVCVTSCGDIHILPSVEMYGDCERWISRVWNEVVVTCFMVLYRPLLDGLKGMSKNLCHVAAVF